MRRKVNLKKKKQKKITQKDIFLNYKKRIWAIFFSGLLLLSLVFLFASLGFLGFMPDHTALENPKTNLATEIISSDGITIGKFYYRDNRTPVTYNDLPKHLVDALVATEDRRYKDHSGVDFKGTLRAVVKLGKDGGGSTISQQLAKQLFHGEGSKSKFGRIAQKIKEWVIAIRLEKQYTKEEIIAQYFNIYDFGNGKD